MESRVFWGVLCALLVASGIFWALVALGVLGAGAMAQRAADAQAQQVADDAAASLRAQQAARLADLNRRTLGPHQRCYAGAVVQVSGSTFTQLGSISYPIHCVGNLADKPLR